jgi:hypothetical protein
MKKLIISALFVIFLSSCFKTGNNNNLTSSTTISSTNYTYDNVLDGIENITSDAHVEYNGELFKDTDIGYSLIVPNDVYLEYSNSYFVSTETFFSQKNPNNYSDKYFVLISKNKIDDLKEDYGEDVYQNLVSSYNQKYDNKVTKAVFINGEIVGEYYELRDEYIQSPMADISFIKNDNLISIRLRYFPSSLNMMSAKYYDLISSTSGEKSWIGGGKNIIKLVNENNTVAPIEIKVLHNVMNSIIQSLSIEKGTIEIK